MERLACYREDLRRESKTYVVLAKDHVKIGRAKRPRSRLKELQVGNPFQLEVLACVSERICSEEAAHALWQDLRVRGEWFRASPELVEWAEGLERRYGVKRINARIDAQLRCWKGRKNTPVITRRFAA